MYVTEIIEERIASDPSLQSRRIMNIAGRFWVEFEGEDLWVQMSYQELLGVLKPAKGRVRQDVTCPIRDSIIYASKRVERSHVTRVSPLWQNHDVIFL